MPARFKSLDLMSEIMTRKDGGSMESAMHKAYLSHYHHLRRMKKKSNSIAIGSELKADVNSDLDCVVKEQKNTKKLSST